MHALLNLRGSIPEFIHVSDGTMVEVSFLDMLLPEPMRRIVYDDAETDKRFVFITNNFAHCTKRDGKSNSSSNGSSNTCVSKSSTGPLRTR
jgi:hypothetical protein